MNQNQAKAAMRAASFAGIKNHLRKNILSGCYHIVVPYNKVGDTLPFNPYTRLGDSMMIAVNLKINIEFNGATVDVIPSGFESNDHRMRISIKGCDSKKVTHKIGNAIVNCANSMRKSKYD